MPKTSNLHEENSDEYLSAISKTLSCKYFNKEKIAQKKKEASLDDLVHQVNAAVSSGVFEQDVKRKQILSMSLTTSSVVIL